MAPYSSLPEVFTPQRSHNLEVAGSTEKQALQPHAYGLPSTPSDTLSASPYTQASPQTQASPSADDLTNSPKRRKVSIWICAILTALIILGVALGVGLGVGLEARNLTGSTGTQSSDSSGTSSNQSSSSTDGGSSSVAGTHGAFLSTKGAFNGSGISVLSSQFSNISSPTPEDDDSNLLVFFQHHSGEIRWMQQTGADTWDGGSGHEVVASDAKNGTPISAMSARPDGVRQWHVFYVNDDNMLRQKSIDNLTYTWTDGLLNDMNIKMLDDERVGLRACFYSGPIDGTNLNGTSPLAGIRLFAATSETTFDQLAWRSGLSKWVWEQRWQNLNGHTTPACMGWARGSVTYVMFANEQDAINVFWKDTSLGDPSTEAHPINQWRNTSISIPNIDPAAGLGWHGGLYAKTLGRSIIQGWNLTLAAENSSSTAGSALSTVGGSIPAADTRLDLWSYPSGASVEKTEEILILYQAEGDDITLATGNVLTGIWSSNSLPIPE